MEKNMVKFTLQTIPLAQYPGVSLDYRAELLRLCQVSHDGVTADEMTAYLSLAQRIERAGDVLELEPHEHAVLLHRLRAQRWNLIVPEILKFVREFAEAGQVTE